MNFYNVFRPLYILLTITGLFPYSIKFNKNKHFLIIKKSIYLNAFWAVCVVIVLLLFGILHVQFIYNTTKDSTMIDGVLTKVNYVVELFNLIIFCIVSYVYFYLSRYRFVKILNKLAALLVSTGGYEELILKYLRHKIKLVITLIPLTVIFETCLNFTREDSLWKMILVLFNFIITQMIQFIVISYYYSLLKMVAVLLKYIKDNILNITNEKMLTSSFIKIESRSTIITLRRLERMYVEVLEVKRLINYVFQAPLFVSTIQSFHSLVSQSYIIYHGIVVDGNMTTHDFINCSCWLPFQIFKIFAVAHIGQSLKIQIQSLGQALHNVPTEKDDTKLLIEIQHFSSLIRYHGDELSVYGFFPLDATLMFKVIASATMYLIILVQFDKKTSVV